MKMSPVLSTSIIVLLLACITAVSLVIQKLDKPTRLSKPMVRTVIKHHVEADANFYFSRKPKSITITDQENNILFETKETDGDYDHTATLQLPHDENQLSKLKLAVTWEPSTKYNFFSLEFYGYETKGAFHSPADIYEDIVLDWSEQ